MKSILLERVKRYADRLQACDEVGEIRCNVFLDGLAEGEYTSDFVCMNIGLSVALQIWNWCLM